MELIAADVARVAGALSLAIVRRKVQGHEVKGWVSALRHAADFLENTFLKGKAPHDQPPGA